MKDEANLRLMQYADSDSVQYNENDMIENTVFNLEDKLKYLIQASVSGDIDEIKAKLRETAKYRLNMIKNDDPESLKFRFEVFEQEPELVSIPSNNIFIIQNLIMSNGSFIRCEIGLLIYLT